MEMGWSRRPGRRVAAQSFAIALGDARRLREGIPSRVGNPWPSAAGSAQHTGRRTTVNSEEMVRKE
eukprot:scaffold5682_cov32-Tisochrysis_lutea.AAC.1